MMFKCTNNRCKWKGEKPALNIVEGKPYCPTCNYEVQEDIKKSNPFKEHVEKFGKQEPSNKDRLDMFTCAAITGLLVKGKLVDESIAKHAVKMAREVIKELDNE